MILRIAPIPGASDPGKSMSDDDPIPAKPANGKYSFQDIDRIREETKVLERMIASTRTSLDRTRRSLDRLEETLLALKTRERGDSA